MAWVMVDDLTGDALPEGQRHRLTIEFDGDELMGYDVGAHSPSRLLAALGDILGKPAPLELDEMERKLDELEARQVVPEVQADGHQLDEQPTPEPNPGEASEAGNPTSAPSAGLPEVRDAAAKATRKPARAPAKAKSSPTSAPARTGPVPPEERSVPAVAPEHATASVVRVWCYRNGFPVPDSGDVGKNALDAFADAYQRGQRETAKKPAVEPAGDGNRPRPEQLDEAVRRIENGEALNDVSAHTAIPIRRIREIKRQIDNGEVVTG